LLVLSAVLAGLLGFGAYTKAWQRFPALINAVVASANWASNAVTRSGGPKANAPAVNVSVGETNLAASAANGKSLASQTAQTSASQSGSAVPTAAEPAPVRAAAAAPPEERETTGNAVETNLPRKSAPPASVPKKALSVRERASAKNRRTESAPVVTEKPADAAVDAPVIPAKLVHAVTPVYPPEAMLNYITGDVKAELELDAAGKVGEVRVISGPMRLRDAAVEALKRYEYAPATRGGKPIPSKTAATVKFWFNP